MLKYLCLFLFFTLSYPIFAQESFRLSDLDSLENEEQKTKALVKVGKEMAGSGQLRLIAEELLIINRKDSSTTAYSYGQYFLGNYYYKENQYSQAEEAYLKAYSGFLISNDRLAQAESAYSLGSIYFYTDQYRAALNYAQKALDLYYAVDSPGDQAKVMALLCDIYTYMQQYSQAIQFCTQALSIKEELDEKQDKEIILNTIGLVYEAIGSTKKAENYLRRALKFALENNDAYNLATTYSNLGNFYIEQTEFDSAQKFFRKALEIDKNEGDDAGLAYSYFNLGNFYLTQKNFNKAYDYLLNSKDKAKKIGLKDLVISSNALISDYYIKIDSISDAIQLLKESVAEAEKMGANASLAELFDRLAKVYYLQGDSENALIYSRLQAEKMAEMYEKDNVKKIAEIETLYKIEQNEREVDLLLKEKEIQELEKERSDAYIILLTIAIILLFTVIFILYSRNRLKNRVNRKLEKQKDAIEQQKQEISSQNEDLEFKRKQLEERNLHITDSITYARHIQRSLLPQVNDLKLIIPKSFVFYQPKDIVSGDFFWFAKIKNKIALAAIDCTGHGVPGAFMTILANSLLKQIIIESGITSPDLVISLLDQKIKQNLSQQHAQIQTADGLDISLVFIDEEKKVLEFCGAKSVLYINKKSGFDTYVGNRYSVGGLESTEKPFSKSIIPIKEKSFLYMGSDGFQDQFGGENDKKYMKRRLRSFLSNLSDHDINQQQQLVEKEFLDWKSNNDQTDDVLLMGVEIAP